MLEKNLAGIKFPGLDGVYLVPNIGEGGAGDAYMVRCYYERANELYIIGEFNWNDMETAYKNGRPVFLQLGNLGNDDGTFPSDATVEMYSIYYLSFPLGTAVFRRVDAPTTSLITIYNDGRIEMTTTSNLDDTFTKYAPASARAVGKALKSIVKSVNGQTPDANGNVEIPYFNLTEMGLSEISLDGTPADTVCDTTELLSAVQKGPVFIGVDIAGTYHKILLNGINREDEVAQLYGTMCVVYGDGSSKAYAASVAIFDGHLTALVTPLATGTGGAVLYNSPQELDEEQKAQARENIGAMQNGEANSNLNMESHNIENVGSITLMGGTGSGYVEITRSKGDYMNDITTVTSFGDEMGKDVILRGIADGTEDSDAATVGQLNATVNADMVITFDENLNCSHSFQEIWNALQGGRIVKYIRYYGDMTDMRTCGFVGCRFAGNDENELWAGNLYTSDWMTGWSDYEYVQNDNLHRCLYRQGLRVDKLEDDIGDISTTLNSTVKSVNGQTPDENGNVNSVPFFDLVEMGLPAVHLDGAVSSVAADSTELCQAAKIGPVIVKINVTDSNLDLTVPVIATCNGYHYEGNVYSTVCGIVSSYAGTFSLTIESNSDTIDVSLTRILDEYGKAASAVPYLDLSEFQIASLDTPISKIEIDTSDILAVLNDGAEVINVGLSLEDIEYVEATLNVVKALGIYQLSGMISYIYDLDSSPAPYSVTILVTEGELIVYLSECMLYEEEEPSFYKVSISGSGNDWSTQADFKSAMDRYNFTGDITITTINEEMVESYVTQIEVGDMYDYMILHSADGVFRWTDSGVVEKIAEPPSVIGLPESTSSDDGKFLRLVNGVPTWVGLVNAEEVSF